MKVRSYGKLAQLLGQERDVGITVPCTALDLRLRLASECPEAAEALANRRVLICVEDRVVADSHVLAGSECVELLAPVSGG